MRRTRVILAYTLGLAAVLLTIWGVAVQAQGGTTSYSTQALGGSATLPPGTYAGPCKLWVQVNDPAFGLDDPSHQSPPYASEEGFEVAVFDDFLYVGMEADNQYGARVWRTKSGIRIPTGQDDWEEVAEVDGEPFGNDQRQDGMRQNDHIDSLAALSGTLYASTANGGSSTQGTLIYSSTSGASGAWTQVITSGFGDVNNTNFKDMQVFQDWLCGGTANGATGAQVWCTSNGITWTQKNESGFGVVSNMLIASSGVFSGALYVGVYNAGGGNVWRTADLVAWTQVFTSVDRSRVEIAGPFDGYLYIAAGAYDGRRFTDPTIRLYRSATGDPGSWSELDTPIDDDLHNTRTIVDGAAVYNGALYVATMNATTGAEVWRTTDGATWIQVNDDGFGDTHTFAAELIPFNGYLYAWVSDYYSGQKVLRSACPICQARAITGTGRFDFAGVGAVLTFTVESLDVVTICVYPGAPPTVQTDTLPLARHYEIAVSPATGAFAADLTLSYTGAEFAASDVSDESATYLARWTGSGWAACPAGKRNRDTLSNTVTCRDVTAFSTWAIAGTGGAPAVVGGQTIVEARCLGPSRAGVFGALLLAVALAVGAVTHRRFLSRLPSRSSTAERSMSSS